MSKIARLGDTHHGICNHNLPCCPHHVTGTIIEGSGDSNGNSQNIARDHDNVIHNCPHCGTGYIVASAVKTNVNGKKIARIGDTVIYPGGSGVIDSSSNDIDAE
jgi:uncharacterized Zn-binding protein involved in type VI secretion